MKIKIIKKYNFEIVHYADDNMQLFSRFNRISVYRDNKEELMINLPISIGQKLLGNFRILRRLFRLDKMCVLPTNAGYVAFWQGSVYHISREGLIIHALQMEGCRNPLHNSIVNVDGNTLYFGEYGNPNPNGKSVYRSNNGGISWEKVYHISCDRIKHIHSCKWDPYERKIWVLTGDYEGQSYILCADEDFGNVEWIGDGTQYFRAIDLVFRENDIHWCMDSPIKDSYHVILNRKTRSITLGQLFPGPVWYLKELSDGGVLVSTAQEIGPSHKDDKLHIMYTSDLRSWINVAQFEHDGLKKRYFKFGVIGFSDGRQNKDGFFMHAEAVKGYDGKSLFCCLVDDEENK